MTEVSPPPARPSRGRQTFQWLSLFLIVAIPIVAVAWLVFPKATCACSTPALPQSSPIEGVVVGVDSQGLGRVRSFSLLSDNTTWTFQVGSLENPTDFPPSHLAEHQATSHPVRVYFRVENGAAVAYRLEDASATPT